MTTQTSHRFYQNARVHNDGERILLDERTLKTPGGNVFRAPTRALADACAAEWNAQTDVVRPGTMPLTQLVFAALDHGPARRDDLVDHVAKYAATDLLCHRADAPSALVAWQDEVWSPPRDWLWQAIGVMLPLVTGVLAADIAPAEIEKIRRAAASLDDFALAGLAQAVGLSGSAIVGFAMLNGVLGAEEAYSAATLDEEWSLKSWGEDEEARARLDRIRAEFEALTRYFAALD